MHAAVAAQGRIAIVDFSGIHQIPAGINNDDGRFELVIRRSGTGTSA